MARKLRLGAGQASLTPWTAVERRALRRRLLTWYARHARDLPWRRTRDPYRVWLSEVMLQQTQVETVRPYFERFVAAFPDVATLAAADEKQVLRLWEGLGYYRRARGLHAAAQRIVSDYQGEFPRETALLMNLPGIGRYTAGAIASIAFDVPAPILEANTIRLFSRLLGYGGDPSRAEGQRLLWQTAAELLPARAAAQFNQGLMEVGSLVCTPRTPRCDACPLRSYCKAYAMGLQEQIPTASPKLQFTAIHEGAIVVVKRGRVLLRLCAQGERWAGLWDFPRVPIQENEPLLVRRELVCKVREQTGIVVSIGNRLATLKHGVTRFRITLDCYAADYLEGKAKSSAARVVRWLPRESLDALPLSSTGRKLASNPAIFAVNPVPGRSSPGPLRLAR